MTPWKAYFLILLVTLPALILFLPTKTTVTGFPMDDAWISIVIAANVRETGEWAFNPGEGCAGVASPGWTWLLSLFPQSKIPYFYREILAAYSLAVLLAFYPLAGTLPVLFRDCLAGGRRFRGYAAVLISILTFSHGIWFFHLLSGLETCAFVSMGVSALVLYRAGKDWLAGISLAALILLRFEGYLLAITLIVHHLLTVPEKGSIKRQLLGTLVGPLSLCANGSAATLLFHYWRLSGTVLPTTLDFRRFQFQLGPDRSGGKNLGYQITDYLKEWSVRLHDWYWMDGFLPSWGTARLPGGVSFHFLAAILNLTMGLGALVVLGRLFSAGGRGRKTPLSLFAVWTLLHNLAYTIVLPVGGQAGRYQAINLLWPPLLVAIGAQEIGRIGARLKSGDRPHFARSSVSRWMTLIPVLLAVIPWFVSLGVWHEVLMAGINRIEGLNMQAGIWSKKRLPPNSRISASELGAFKVASRLYVVDESGFLVPQGLASFRESYGPDFYRERQVTHLFRILQLGEPDPSFGPAWNIALEKVFEAYLHEEIGIDREACQNNGSRCAIYRIVYPEEESQEVGEL